MKQASAPQEQRGLRAPRWRILVATTVILAVVATLAIFILARHDQRPASARAAPAARQPSAGTPPSAEPLPSIGHDSLTPTDGALLGAWVQPTAGFTDGGQESGIVSFEHAIGRELAVDSLYMSWNQPMPVALAAWDLHSGRVPMITWAGASSAKIVAGAFDAQIRTQAVALKSLGGPVLLRYYPEMDLAAYGKTVGRPARFIAAWRHLHDIFASVGATNVHWVWNATAVGFSTGVAQRFYPGDSYVNWIGADGYNWAPKLRGVRWRSFSDIFSAFYRWGEHEAKPLLVGEFGAVEGRPGEKAAWYAEAGQELRDQFPRIKAIVYFNSIHQNFGIQFDWKVTSSPSALSAFRAFALNPYLGARPST